MSGGKGQSSAGNASHSSTSYTGFYENCYQAPYRELSGLLELSKKAAATQQTDDGATDVWPGRHRDIKSPLFKSKDRAALASYIKLFEPMVIKALEVCTLELSISRCKINLMCYNDFFYIV